MTDWYWEVEARIGNDSKMRIYRANAPYRAAAKRAVRRRAADVGVAVHEWGETYVPRPRWDCPICGSNESMRETPNLSGDHDWECWDCGSKGWGEPMDWDYLSEPHSRHFINGHREPDGPAFRAFAYVDEGDDDE